MATTVMAFSNFVNHFSFAAHPDTEVTVGLLDDADPETLAEIARVTGGSSHVAQTTDEIVRVFADAVGRRGGA